MTVMGSLIVALLIGETVYEIATGNLLARGWKPYLRREQNPMVYWSTIGLQVFIISVVVCFFCLLLLSPNH
jgi:hypothetical protein